MKTSDLASVVKLDAVKSLNGSRNLLAVGPLTVQPGSTPFRTVLADNGDEFVVWDEIVPNYPDVRGAGFTNGQYFEASKLPRALAAFASRLLKNVDTVESIYRAVA